MTTLPNSPANCSRSVSAFALGQREDVLALTCVEEEAVAFHYNGFAYGVMMASPCDIEDFAIGFSLSEGVIDRAADIRSLSVSQHANGISIDVALEGRCLQRFLAHRRVRNLRGNTSCGLCGVQDLAEVRRPAVRVPTGRLPNVGAVISGFERLREWQPLSKSTRGAHAAAWARDDGSIVAVREDVGRHNALDKLIGAGLRGVFSSADGFCLLTSRCSFEMVQKAIAAGFSAVASASAPTALAIRTADEAGLTLCSLSRERGPLVFTSHDMSEEPA